VKCLPDLDFSLSERDERECNLVSLTIFLPVGRLLFIPFDFSDRLLGFPLVLAPRHCFGFDVESSLPTQRHLTRMLRKIPNTCLQFLLDETVRLLQDELATEIDDFGQCISLDTKE
jgi:hypothetical protein